MTFKMLFYFSRFIKTFTNFDKNFCELGLKNFCYEMVHKSFCELDCKNYKAGRQTSECKAMLVWTCKKKRKRLCGEKDNGDGGDKQKEKRKAKEKVDRFGERRHAKGWS